MGCRSRSPVDEQQFLCEADGVRMLPVGFRAGVPFLFSSSVRNRFLFGGVGSGAQPMSNSTFAKPIGSECFQKGSGPEPFFIFKFGSEPISILGCRPRSPTDEQQFLCKADRVRRFPKGFLAGALLNFSSPARNRFLCQSRWGINASDGGSGPEPFFNLSVLFETDVCYWVMVLGPHRSATSPSKADRV